MLRVDSKNTSFSGVSIVNDQQIASMSANYSTGSNLYFNFNIERLDLYEENSEAVDTDFMTFKDTVLEGI